MINNTSLRQSKKANGTFFFSDSSLTLDKKVTDNLFNGHIQNALGGFIFVLSEDGQVLYISPNVSENLGLQQVC